MQKSPGSIVLSDTPPKNGPHEGRANTHEMSILSVFGFDLQKRHEGAPDNVAGVPGPKGAIGARGGRGGGGGSCTPGALGLGRHTV